MPQKKVAGGPARNIILFVYCLVMAAAAAWSLKTPAYNWDMLPYMGVVLSYNNNTISKDIHTEVYAIAKQKIPPLFYNRLVDPSNAYRNGMAKNDVLFRSQFPFYVVKPLYTGIAYLFYKSGFDLTAATVWPSAIAYCCSGLLLFCWMRKYWIDLYACIGSVLIMFSPPLITVAGLSSPDALSGCLLFTAIYFLVEKKSTGRTFFFLLLSVFARLDNIVPAVVIMLVLFLVNYWSSRAPVRKIIFFGTALGAAYFAVSRNVQPFGWSVFFYPAFAKQLNSSYTASHEFDFAAYISLAKTQLLTGLYFSSVSFFFFLVLLLLWNAAPFKPGILDTEQMLALAFLLIIIVRFVLQPLVADRLYIPYYLSITAFLVKRNSMPAAWRQLIVK